MNSKSFWFLALGPYVVVAAAAVRLAMAWHQLPSRMATHFDARGVPNGWSSPASFAVAMFATALLSWLLLVSIAYQLRERRRFVSLSLLALECFTALVIAAGVWKVIDCNLNPGTRVTLGTLFWIPLALVMLCGFAIGIDWRWWVRHTQTAPEFKHAPVIAEERHGSAAMALLIAGPVAICLFVMLGVAAPEQMEFVIVPVAVLIATAAAVTWYGFTYRFTTAGVEVRCGGLRLRRIPKNEIEAYAPEIANPLVDFGGWGVKGYGNETAYILWGRKVLHIKTSAGDIFLGHREPEQLARDLDAVRNAAQ